MQSCRRRRVYLDFDGVMAFPKVSVNGKLAGEWSYGYTSFRVDATPLVKFGGRNVLAVRADRRKLLHGKAMLILRTREGAEGEVRVTASSGGLRAGEATVHCRSRR